MKERKLPICIRPTCTRAALPEYDGYCFGHAKALGIAHHNVPWEKVHTELQRLYNGGWTNKALFDDHGMFHSVLLDISKRRREQFRYRTYAALKSIPTLSPYRRPAWPLRRRVNALRAIGHTFAEIGREIGEPGAKVQHLSYERATWAPVELDQKIRSYYQAHHADPARETDAKTKKAHLAAPFDWDNIDDPNEHAESGKPRYKIGSRPQRITPKTRSMAKALITHHGRTNASKILRLRYTTLLQISNGKRDTLKQKDLDRIRYHYRRLPAATPTTPGQAA